MFVHSVTQFVYYTCCFDFSFLIYNGKQHDYKAVHILSQMAEYSGGHRIQLLKISSFIFVSKLPALKILKMSLKVCG